MGALVAHAQGVPCNLRRVDTTNALRGFTLQMYCFCGYLQTFSGTKIGILPAFKPCVFGLHALSCPLSSPAFLVYTPCSAFIQALRFRFIRPVLPTFKPFVFGLYALFCPLSSPAFLLCKCCPAPPDCSVYNAQPPREVVIYLLGELLILLLVRGISAPLGYKPKAFLLQLELDRQGEAGAHGFAALLTGFPLIHGLNHADGFLVQIRIHGLGHLYVG